MLIYKFITNTLNMKPHVHATHSHEILFTTHTYLTFTFSLINADSRNAGVNLLLGLSYSPDSLSCPAHTGRVWEPS